MWRDRGLLGLLALLLGIAGVWWWTGERSALVRDRSFPEVLLHVDTAALAWFSLGPSQFVDNPPLVFHRTANGWVLRSATDSTAIPANAIGHILAPLAPARVARPIGTSDAIKERYELGPEHAVLLRLGTPNGIVDLSVGAAENDPLVHRTTAVRIGNSEEMFAVVGDLSTAARKGFTDWVPKPLVMGDTAHWRSISFIFPDAGGYTLHRSAGGWAVDGLSANHEKVAKYIGNLAIYEAAALAPPSDTLGAVPGYRITVQDDRQEAPLVFTVYTNHGRLLGRSSQSPAYRVLLLNPELDLQRLFRSPHFFLAH